MCSNSDHRHMVDLFQRPWPVTQNLPLAALVIVQGSKLEVNTVLVPLLSPGLLLHSVPPGMRYTANPEFWVKLCF